MAHTIDTNFINKARVTMFGFKKRSKQQTQNLEIGSEVYFVDTINRSIQIFHGTIKEIYMCSDEIRYAAEPKNQAWTQRGNKDYFFKTKNECIEYWINHLEQQRE